jgi:hypothetical protein
MIEMPQGSPDRGDESSSSLQDSIDMASDQGKKKKLVKKKIKDIYVNQFKKEVDFHHKIAYRFEKAYRLGKKSGEKKAALNLEIIDCISDLSGYVETDPMTLFYCLFFCIYYNNADLIKMLLRFIIKKVPHQEKTDKLLEQIDMYGIDRIR